MKLRYKCPRAALAFSPGSHDFDPGAHARQVVSRARCCLCATGERHADQSHAEVCGLADDRGDRELLVRYDARVAVERREEDDAAAGVPLSWGTRLPPQQGPQRQKRVLAAAPEQDRHAAAVGARADPASGALDEERWDLRRKRRRLASTVERRKLSHAPT